MCTACLPSLTSPVTEQNDLEKELQQWAVALGNLQTSMKASVKSHLLAHPTSGFTAENESTDWTCHGSLSGAALASVPVSSPPGHWCQCLFQKDPPNISGGPSSITFTKTPVGPERLPLRVLGAH